MHLALFSTGLEVEVVVCLVVCLLVAYREEFEGRTRHVQSSQTTLGVIVAQCSA